MITFPRFMQIFSCSTASVEVCAHTVPGWLSLTASWLGKPAVACVVILTPHVSPAIWPQTTLSNPRSTGSPNLDSYKTIKFPGIDNHTHTPTQVWLLTVNWLVEVTYRELTISLKTGRLSLTLCKPSEAYEGKIRYHLQSVRSSL